jgi:hypothetical protein
MTDEEQVIRDWLAGQLNPDTGSPLPPSKRLSQPLPRRQVPAVVETLLRLLDEARAVPAPLDDGGLDELRAAARLVIAAGVSNRSGDKYRVKVAAFDALDDALEASDLALAETLRNRE